MSGGTKVWGAHLASRARSSTRIGTGTDVLTGAGANAARKRHPRRGLHRRRLPEVPRGASCFAPAARQYSQILVLRRRAECMPNQTIKVSAGAANQQPPSRAKREYGSRCGADAAAAHTAASLS